MHLVTCDFKFCAMHRLVGHRGKCRHIHGHNYRARVFLKSERLNELGILVDFSDIKKTIGNWIDSNWDHNSILNRDDDILKLGRTLKSAGVWVSEYAMFDDKLPFVMQCNPTAENMAKELYRVSDIYYPGMIHKVQIFETDSCSAVYSECKKDSPNRVPFEDVAKEGYTEHGDGG